MTGTINPKEYLEILKQAEKALDCAGVHCTTCPINLASENEVMMGCLSVKVTNIIKTLPDKCPTCGAVKNG